MARYRIAKDGHPYLTHGYRLLDNHGQDDVRFSTYQVNTGGERAFEQAGFVDGDKVSEETFFALLLDGDLYNDARPNGIKITSVPNRVLASMEYEVNTNRLDQINIQLDQIIIQGEVYLSDILAKLRPHFKDPVDALSTASWLCIFRYWKADNAKTQPRPAEV